MNEGSAGGGLRGVGRGRGAWQQPESPPKELRRPKQASQPQLSSASGENQQSLGAGDAIVTQSKLSAEAKEWYPPNYVPPSMNVAPPSQPARNRFSVQNRLRVRQHEVPADSYALHDLSNALSQYETSDEWQGDMGPEDAAISQSLLYLVEGMCEVTVWPGRFDTLCGPLVDAFAPTLHQPAHADALVDAILAQSIAEPNFRYNGARLCSMYDAVDGEGSAEVDDNREGARGGVFRARLLHRLALEHDRIVAGVETSAETARGFAMFVGELYSALEDGRGRRLRPLADTLAALLTHLLDTGDARDLSAATQLLKLTGLALDADVSGAAAGIWARLAQLAHEPHVARLLQLRQQRWHQATTQTHVEQALTGVGNGESERGGEPEAAFILADGSTLSAEERAFLAQHHRLEEDGDEEDEGGEEWGETDEGMDGEMRAGFIEFLKLSNQIPR